MPFSLCAIHYKTELSKRMQTVESGSALKKWLGVVAILLWVEVMTQRRCIGWFVARSAWLDHLIIYVWEPLSSMDLICCFLVVRKLHGFTTKHRGLGLQKDGWSCGFHSLHNTN